jgi:hypothetical protein
MTLKRIDFTISVTLDEAHELQRVADFQGKLITQLIKELALAETHKPQVRMIA